MPRPCTKVARGLLLYGLNIEEGTLTRSKFMAKIGVAPNTFRAAGEDLGSKKRDPGLRFFDSSANEWIAFGPGAGLALGISIGTASIRATLVDANGKMHCEHEGETSSEQLSMDPDAFMRRVADAARAVLQEGLSRRKLLVRDALPLLGVAVAWPTPIDRDKKPVGPSLADDTWRLSGRSLTDRVAEALHVPIERVYVLNDAHAAAMAVAFDRTRDQSDNEYLQHSELEIVVRLSATVSAATVIIEAPTAGTQSDDHGLYGPTSGIIRSSLISGRDGHAGEIAHLPVSQATLSALDTGAVTELGPLVAVRCSCSGSGQQVPDHLEAFTATEAVAARLAPGKHIGPTIHDLRGERPDARQRRVLEDVGVLLGDALGGPVAMLNPAGITLTGALAVPTVQHTMRSHLTKIQAYGTAPAVRILPNDDNKYVRARGAGLAVTRRAVYRRLIPLLDGSKAAVRRNVATNVIRLKAVPF